MPKNLASKLQASSDSDLGAGVLRMAKVIPVMDRPAVVQEATSAPKSMVCAGRCGHCDVHPCQLHTSV